MPAVTTVKRKLFTKIGVDSSCSICLKTITSESGRGLRCDIVTMPSMKNVFQNTIRSTFPFLKMQINSSVTCVTKCNRPRAAGLAMKNGWKKKVITMNIMMMMIWMNYLTLQINKSKRNVLVSEHYNTMNG